MAYTPSSVYASGEDLIVCDEDIELQITKFKQLGQHIQSTLDSYISYLEKLKNEGLMKGATAEALNEYISYSKKLENVFDKMGTTYSTYLEQFLKDVDTYDEELY